MSDIENDVEIEIAPTEEDLPDQEIVVAKAEAGIPVEIGIAELKLKLEEEKVARQAAELRANEASQQANLAKTDANDSNIRLIDNAIDTVRRNADILKQNLRDAMAAGDYDAAADIQMSMTKTELDMRDLLNGKKQYEASLRAQPVRDVDPVEALAGQLTPRSAAWVRAHPEYAREPRLYQKMIAAHQMAMADNIQPDTDDYFSTIESTLQINRRNDVEQESPMSSASSASSGRRAAPPAAPVSRSGTGTGSRPNVVTLTRAEREMARDMGMNERDYAKNKMALMREGKLNS